MKRLLTSTGSIFVHVDWHASHYVKVELDKIFGYGNFQNEIVWCYRGGGVSKSRFGRKHDVILWYTKSGSWTFVPQYTEYSESTKAVTGRTGRRVNRSEIDLERGAHMPDWWADINSLQTWSPERVGYPTQKPRALIERIIESACPQEGIVADFFCGGGTTPEAAQMLGRRWIASDISRVAVSLTADRAAKAIESDAGRDDVQGSLLPVADFTISNWGTYEVDHLTELDEAAFREFVVKAFAGRLATGAEDVHGYKEGEPLYVGSPRQDEAIGIEHVGEFAKALLRRSGTDEAKGTMLGWAFAPEAQVAVDRLLAQRKASIRFVRLKLVTLESPEFKAHVVERSPQYEHLLTFVLPPAVRFSAVRVGPKKYRFDSSESQSLNAGGSIINVQWDFDYRHYFTSSPGFEFARAKDMLSLDANYEFSRAGKFRVACRMQDDVGGQATAIAELEVT